MFAGYVFFLVFYFNKFSIDVFASCPAVYFTLDIHHECVGAKYGVFSEM